MTATDHIANRDAVEAALRAELVGPDPRGSLLETATPAEFKTWAEANGPWRDLNTDEEIISRDPPTKRYGIGVIYPAGDITPTELDVGPRNVRQ